MMESVLPNFSFLSEAASSDEIERWAERLMDRADAILLGGKCSQQDYDEWVKRLNQFVAQQYQ